MEDEKKEVIELQEETNEVVDNKKGTTENQKNKKKNYPIKRVEIVLYFNYKASTVDLCKNLGADVEYVNKRAGYLIMYIDQHKAKRLTDTLKHTKGFKRYEYSPTQLVELDLFNQES